jgi:agmatine/peptidylarginine deiminase
MLTWPHPATDWRDLLPQVEPLYLEIARQIAARQSLLIVCHDRALQARVLSLLQHAEVPRARVIPAIAPCNDTWARDHGPLTVLTGAAPRLCDFRFNGWGGKHEAALDDRITANLCSAGLFGKAVCEPVELVLEGGAIETDGEGTLLATSHSIVTATRNPGLDRVAVERLLTAHLGLQRFLWLEHGHLSGDDTDGHIDTLARFADPHTILYATAYEDDPDHAGLAAMAEELTAFRRADGEPYRLVPLPPISPQYGEDGARLPAGYANFLIINGAVLLPVYGDANDGAAVECLRRAFPDREIVPLDCRPLIHQNGSLHCITMQFPKALTIRTEN